MGKIALLVPAHNEEKVIGMCLVSLLNEASAEDIYVVNDGSEDQTETEAKKHTQNVLTLTRSGKASALSEAIGYFHLADRYDFIMPFDADTKISDGFLEEIIEIFTLDVDSKIAAVAGKVVGTDFNWVTTYRAWEYEIAQTIHKEAQSVINAIIVCPGCATVFRSRVFKNMGHPKGTLTEDMDLTFLIHRKKLGKIVFTQNSYVLTQDPRTIRELLKQIDRWYLGFWQCLVKHNIPWGGQILDLEVALLASEGLFNGLLVIAFLLFLPFIAIRNPLFIAVPLALDFILFLVPTLLIAYKKTKFKKLFIYIPQFYFLRVLGSMIFFRSFLKIVVGIDLSMSKLWNMSRYKLTTEGKEEVWLNPSLQ
ncbi:hypothetical protein A2955_03100 [Candidatus Woesebacteria bacterium RIFCSPLOWO2_01_FULL_37_19]|uniref:Glycosyltransferase 2-like domain-containing protein n=2 Tax=Candidatus Woeseibacteriota TaxID=1752722 RepID=A0A1F8B8M9_9BACT|nr:MAG: hypothetical protein A2771_03855 [Candidatus Woesebacteria bacterium RIFCSPHIGHO2_01_FULL_38_26b]OGM60406.1 MAG: hypothetical protein A2955_03100 [Candidatus Woesebacteria bacterium RIFCSPLOWO2_01_FULL_37_19]